MLVISAAKSELKLFGVRSAMDELARMNVQLLGKHIGELHIKSYPAKSNVSSEPFGLERMAEGALSRAIIAMKAKGTADMVIGVENGIIKSGTTYLYVPAVAVIYPRGNFTGASIGGGIPIPESWLREVRDGEGRQQIGHIARERLGTGVKDTYACLTNRVTNRPKVIADAIILALAPLISPREYGLTIPE